MAHRIWKRIALGVVSLCLPVALSGCMRIVNSILPDNGAQSGDVSNRFGGSIGNGDQIEDTMVIIGGEDGIFGAYPEDSFTEETLPPEEPTEALVTLPDGTQVSESEIMTLEDGTVVVPHQRSGLPSCHKCFFPDGTYAITDYYDDQHSACSYADAAQILVVWYYENGEKWRNDEYTVKPSGELFMTLRYEYEYSPLEVGADPDKGDAYYHSATNELFYDEERGCYVTARSEYDPVYGSSCPNKCIYHDDSYSLHEYNLDGTRKRDRFYQSDGTLTNLLVYDHGLLTADYLYRDDGSQWYETHYENGEIKLQRFFGENSDYQSVTYYRDGVRYYEEENLSYGVRRTTTYDANGNAEKSVINGPDGSYQGKILYEYYSDGTLKKSTTYDANDQITQIEEYDPNGSLIVP